MKVPALLISYGGLNKVLYFIFLCLTSIAIDYASRTLLISDDLYFRFFGDQLTYERITEIIYLQNKWEWVSYVLVPLYYLIKIFLVGLCVYIGVVITGIDISFNKIFQIALLAEVIFLIPNIIKLCWFAFIQTQYTLSNIQFFFPFSLLSFFQPDAIDLWLIYPLQLMNIFEIVYLFMLAYGLFIVTKRSYVKMLGLTAYTYGTGLFIWTISIMFLTVSFSA